MDCARDSEVDATLLSLKKFLTLGLHVRVYLVHVPGRNRYRRAR
jgi:hypothetical protein